MEHFIRTKKTIERIIGDTVLGEISEDSRLEVDLGCDSLDIVEIILEVEDEFSIEIPDVDLKNLKSVNDLINYVKEKETK
jgi:acyl carrier protein